VTIDTTEGTWLQVDVSPDGTTLVFDLLGDLWSVPYDGGRGGEAKLLLGGAAWEWQPRFSPDGKRIAYVSDPRPAPTTSGPARPTAATPRQVTKEDFRLVHSPEWSPDGEWLVVRKHFTHTRSLGPASSGCTTRADRGRASSLTDKSRTRPT
jgi:Tol biopolymer transport system component